MVIKKHIYIFSLCFSEISGILFEISRSHPKLHNWHLDFPVPVPNWWKAVCVFPFSSHSAGTKCHFSCPILQNVVPDFSWHLLWQILVQMSNTSLLKLKKTGQGHPQTYHLPFTTYHLRLTTRPGDLEIWPYNQQSWQFLWISGKMLANIMILQFFTSLGHFWKYHENFGNFIVFVK